jgi:hypothetical protein
VPLGRVPRVARLLALALRCEQLVAAGVIANYAALAELRHVSRARVSQILNSRLWPLARRKPYSFCFRPCGATTRSTCASSSEWLRTWIGSTWGAGQ